MRYVVRMRMNKPSPYILAICLVLIIGCKKDDSPKGPFITITDIKRFEINTQYDYSAITPSTSDSCIVIALSCLDNTLQVIKIDQNFSTVWDVKIEDNFDRMGNIIETTEKDYLIICAPKGEFFHSGWIKLIKLSNSGQVIWTKEYLKSSANVFHGSSIQQMADGNFILTSTVLWDSLMLIKVNNDGDSLWSREYTLPNASFGSANSMIDQSGRFIYTNAQKIIGFNSDGEIVWQTPYYDYDVFNSLSISINEGFYATGFNLYGKIYSARFLVRKFSETGVMEWNKTYTIGVNGYGRSLCPSNNGCIFILGTAQSPESNKNTTTLIKADRNGNELYHTALEELKIPNTGIYIAKESSGFRVFGFEDSGSSTSTVFYSVKFIEIN